MLSDVWLCLCHISSFLGMGVGQVGHIYVKLEKFKRGRSLSFCILSKREILRTNFRDINFVHQHSNSG